MDDMGRRNFLKIMLAGGALGLTASEILLSPLPATTPVKMNSLEKKLELVAAAQESKNSYPNESPEIAQELAETLYVEVLNHFIHGDRAGVNVRGIIENTNSGTYFTGIAAVKFNYLRAEIHAGVQIDAKRPGYLAIKNLVRGEQDSKEGLSFATADIGAKGVIDYFERRRFGKREVIYQRVPGGALNVEYQAFHRDSISLLLNFLQSRDS